MDKNSKIYTTYIDILKEELKPAMGCTEPIALAYAGAVARKYLIDPADKIEVFVSGSIIKNVKSVIIPNTDNMKGIEAAVAAGMVAGNAEKELEVIAEVSSEDKLNIRKYIENTDISVEYNNDGDVFDICVKAYKEDSYVKVHILKKHTNIVEIEKDGEIIFENKKIDVQHGNYVDKSLLNVRDIWEFINIVEISDIKDVLDCQIEYNMAIAKEGINGDYGANIGKMLMCGIESDIKTEAKAMAAAGSDARMNGCEMPVVINSGSGNQGITASVPVIVYAEKLGVDKDKLYRALALSNLVAIHQKNSIGTLSAYCGVVSAGVSSGAAIAYLCGGTIDDIEHTIVNALAITSGIICDGAKASCAAKIATAVDAGIMGYNMCSFGKNFNSGDGIIGEETEKTIENVGRLGKDGMKGTNEEIINIMLGK